MEAEGAMHPIPSELQRHLGLLTPVGSFEKARICHLLRNVSQCENLIGFRNIYQVDGRYIQQTVAQFRASIYSSLQNVKGPQGKHAWKSPIERIHTGELW